MKRLSGLGLTVTAALFAATAAAHDGPHHGNQAAAAPASWDFVLPTLDGKRFVQASGVVGPLLVNFWGRDCAPCVAELPRLQAFADANPHWTVLLVSTDPPADAAAFLGERGIDLPTLRPGANVSGLMRAAGNRQGALPFTVSLRQGSVCRTALGTVSDTQLSAIAAECGVPR